MTLKLHRALLSQAGFLLFLICSLSFGISEEPTNSLVEDQVLLQIKQLSSQEQEVLKVFFYDLFANNEFGYTLFGDKPMSFCYPLSSIIGIATKERFFHIYMGGHLPIRHGWEIWKNLKKSKDSNFIFIVYEKYHIPEIILFINKKKFFSIIHDNIDLFKKAYGMQFTVESFLQDLIDKKITLQELFKRSDLLGVLLGYGRRNAELFQRRLELFNKQQLLPFWNFLLDAQSRLLDQKIQGLNEHLQVIDHTSMWLNPVSPVSFVADLKDPETHSLLKKYTQVHKELISLFRSENWVPLVVEKLESSEHTSRD